MDFVAHSTNEETSQTCLDNFKWFKWDYSNVLSAIEQMCTATKKSKTDIVSEKGTFWCEESWRCANATL